MIIRHSDELAAGEGWEGMGGVCRINGYRVLVQETGNEEFTTIFIDPHWEETPPDRENMSALVYALKRILTLSQNNPALGEGEDAFKNVLVIWDGPWQYEIEFINDDLGLFNATVTHLPNKGKHVDILSMTDWADEDVE